MLLAIPFEVVKPQECGPHTPCAGGGKSALLHMVFGAGHIDHRRWSAAHRFDVKTPKGNLPVLDVATRTYHKKT